MNLKIGFLLFLNLFISKTDLKTYTEKLNYKAQKICRKENSLFCKTYQAYLKKETDSCYIFCEQALLKTNSTEEKDILNYIQSESCIQKRLLKKALQHALQISEDSFLKNLKYVKLGSIYLGLSNYKKSIHFYNLLDLHDTSIDKTIQIKSLHNLATAYLHIEDYINSEKYFLQIEKTASKNNDTLMCIHSKINLGNLYYNQYKDAKALTYFKKAYELSKLFSNLKLKESTAKNLAIVEKNRKNYEKSIHYYLEAGKWKDSIWNRDNIWKLAEKDKQFALAQKELEIQLQNEKLKSQLFQRNALIIGTFILLVFAVVLSYLYKQKTLQKKSLDIVNQTKDYLFSVVSHDLRSPMNNLKIQHKKILTQLSKNDISSAEKITQDVVSLTENTTSLLNNVLHWALEQSQQIDFHQEIRSLESIIEQVVYDFQEAAKAKNITLEISTSNLLVYADIESLKIVLRNLIDNALKYTNTGGKISLQTENCSNNQCLIKIEDTGIGISNEILEKINTLDTLSTDQINRSKGIGLGMLLCKTLIAKNGGSLHLKSTLEKGTKILILLPTKPKQT